MLKHWHERRTGKFDKCLILSRISLPLGMKITIKEVATGIKTVMNHEGMEQPYHAIQIELLKENGFLVVTQTKL